MNDTVLAAEAKPNKKVAFVSRPYSRDDKIKKDEEELKQMLEEQKAETETPPAEPEEKQPAEQPAATNGSNSKAEDILAMIRARQNQ